MNELALEEPIDPLAWLVDPRRPDDHTEVLARPELVVPVTGSGITAPLGYPRADELARELREIARRAGSTESDLEGLRDPRSIADVLIERGLIERDELLQHVARMYSNGAVGTSETIDRLLRIRSHIIFTLNYDHALEDRAAQLLVECEPLVLESSATRVHELLDPAVERRKLAIVHAHGIASEPETIVLDREGYGRLLGSLEILFALRLLLVNQRLLFMGTRLDELHLLQALLQSRTQKLHMFVAPKAEVDDLHSETRSAFVPETYRLVMRGYNSHDDLIPLVEMLGPPPGEEPAASPPAGPQFPTVGAAPPADYVDVLRVETREARDDDLDSSFMFALGLRSGVTIEQIAAEGARTLIQGAPGSGKSTLLLALGQRLPERVTVLWLSARQLELVGDANRLLPQWLRSAKAFREGQIMDAQRLETEVFHFLIDGLDEIPASQQAVAAERIIQVAAVNPNHSFTVASRMIPSLEQFTRSEWAHVKLAPATKWRQAYLEKRGRSWDQLVQTAPLLGDLSGLLELPFFLSQTVDLFEQGSLGETGDFLSLVQRFVDAGLEGVTATMPPEVIRPWLRRLALAMLLAGRSDLHVDEIAASLPDELLAFGDAAAVAERLVSATLWRANGEGMYSFIHRILGEALAAEALLELDPESSGILDVAAPIVNAKVRGLRDDWLVPMTVVAAASENWRRELSKRDPLAAARATPPGATVEERESASRAIWQSYVEWRIWLSNYRLISIVEDESVLARLLAGGGLEELQNEIREAITSGSRETVGNAINVLANLGDRTIEPDLRRILEASDDPVLRRIAGLAARDLELDSLFYLIAHRALSSIEDTEVQDLMSAAFDLALPEEIAPFARKAARRGGDASMIVGYKVRGRISPREELAVLRVWASRRGEPITSQRDRLKELIPALDLDDAGIAEDVIFVAGSWKIQTEDVTALIRDHQEAAARAVIKLSNEKAAYDFELFWILTEIGVEQLIASGAPEAMISNKQHYDASRREQEKGE